MNRALAIATIAMMFLATSIFLSLPQTAEASETMIVGVNYSNTASTFLNRDAALMHEAGINMVRLMFSPYAQSNSLPSLVPAIVNAKIAVLGVLYNEALLDANNINGWSDYVYKTVSTYKNYVKVWEVWNEPDWNTGFAPDGQVGNVVKYTQWLKAAYPQAKQADPTCRIIGGSISVVQDNTLTWLSKMYDNGARTYMDVLSVHPYSNANPLPPAITSGGKAFWRAQDARNIMIQRGDTNKRMWFTEIGWRTYGTGGQVVVTEALQAQYIKDALTYAKTNWAWLETFIIYQWQDGGGDYFGLLRNDGSRKPSFYAVKAFNTAGATSTITVTTPNGGQNWVRGTVNTITWTSTGSPGANVKIELLKAGVLAAVVSSSTTNDGSYSWTIYSSTTVGTDYKIRITSTSDTAITDSSDNNFAINAGASARIYIEHTYRGDLVVDIGVGDTASPLWSSQIWNRQGGSADNLDLTVDLSAATAYLPPSNTHRWVLKVYDAASGDQGKITQFSIMYQGITYSSTDVPVTVSDLKTSYAYIPNSAQAHVYIQHTYRGDLIVDIGVGSTSTPVWSKRIWNGTGGTADNLDLYVDLSGAVAYLPPSTTYTWWVKVYDKAAVDTGKIVTFTIEYPGKTYTSPDVPAPISDLKTSYAYIKG